MKVYIVRRLIGDKISKKFVIIAREKHFYNKSNRMYMTMVTILPPTCNQTELS